MFFAEVHSEGEGNTVAIVASILAFVVVVVIAVIAVLVCRRCSKQGTFDAGTVQHIVSPILSLSSNHRNFGADHQSCTGGARITAEGGSLKRDLRTGSVCMSVCLSVCLFAPYCDVT